MEQLDTTIPSSPLTSDLAADVVIVGAGIAGISTAFFMLRDTPATVVLLERGRAGCGASGRNAGQLVTYFERPLCDLVDAFGFDMATRGQAEIEAAWGLLDEMLALTGAAVQVERLVGAMGMFSLNQLLVHLKNVSIRNQAGLDREAVEISNEAEFLDRIPEQYRDLYTLVPQSRIRERLEIDSDDYVAVLLNRKGCANSALLCQEVLAFLRRQYADRFTFVDQTTVANIVLEQTGAKLSAGRYFIAASRVVLCTNGFNHHTIDNQAGGAVPQRLESKVHPRVGYMVGYLTAPGALASATSYINNEEIGGKKPYYYVTRRPYVRNGEALTLTCLGGPEVTFEDTTGYEAEGDMPLEVANAFDTQVRPAVAAGRLAGLEYDYTWHGLMAYTDNKIRLVGFEPRNPVLMYNLGCNGVGFLPSIAGGLRIANLHSGQTLQASIFDPH
ncbi:MAG: FAD-binding oxidoreductase [Devosia sp.]